MGMCTSSSGKSYTPQNMKTIVLNVTYVDESLIPVECFFSRKVQNLNSNPGSLGLATVAKISSSQTYK